MGKYPIFVVNHLSHGPILALEDVNISFFLSFFLSTQLTCNDNNIINSTSDLVIVIPYNLRVIYKYDIDRHMKNIFTDISLIQFTLHPSDPVFGYIPDLIRTGSFLGLV